MRRRKAVGDTEMMSHEAAGAFPEGRKLRIDASALLQRIYAACEPYLQPLVHTSAKVAARVKVELATCKPLASKTLGMH